MKRPVLEYGNIVWCPNLKKHALLLENIQRRFTKMIIGMNNLAYDNMKRQAKVATCIAWNFGGQEGT